jgi:hypothetical protein
MILDGMRGSFSEIGIALKYLFYKHVPVFSMPNETQQNWV